MKKNMTGQDLLNQPPRGLPYMRNSSLTGIDIRDNPFLKTQYTGIAESINNRSDLIPSDTQDKTPPFLKRPASDKVKALTLKAAGKKRPGSNDNRKTRVKKPKLSNASVPPVNAGASTSNSDSGYEASGLKNSLHGSIFQAKYTALVLQKVFINDYKFKVASEMSDAEGYDDRVVKYRRKDATTHDSGKYEVNIVFYQDKHVLFPKENHIDLGWFTSSNGNFNLEKLYKKYKEIIKKPPSIGINCLVGEDEHYERDKFRFIAATNAYFKNADKSIVILGEKKIPISFEEVVGHDDPLRFSGESYKLGEDTKKYLKQNYNNNEDNQIDEFCRQFRIHTNQPNENEIDELLIENIADKYHWGKTRSVGLSRHILLKGIDWLQRSFRSYKTEPDGKIKPIKKANYLTNDNFENLFTHFKADISQLEMNVFGAIYDDLAKTVSGEGGDGQIFTEPSIPKELTNFLSLPHLQNNKKIFHLQVPTSTRLGALKVNQSLNKKFLVDKPDQTVSVYLNMLALETIQESVKTAFKDVVDNNKLLVIECDPRDPPLFPDTIKTIEDTINSLSKNHKVIIITSEKKESLLVNQLNLGRGEEKIPLTTDNSYDFASIEQTARDTLLEKSRINFQGNEVATRELLKDDPFKSFVINAETLDNMLGSVVEHNHPVIGKKLPELSYANHGYVSRKLERGFRIEKTPEDSPKIEKMDATLKKSHFFLVKVEQGNMIPVKEKIKSAYRDFIATFTVDFYKKNLSLSIKKRLDHAKENYPDMAIHYLVIKDDSLVWESSQGSFGELLDKPLRHIFLPAGIKETDFIRFNENKKVEIIIGPSGSGKSELLKSLALRLKTESPDSWVINIDLSDSAVLKEIGNDITGNKDEVEGCEFINFLKGIKELSDENDLGGSIFRKMLITKDDNGPIILFDGYDEATSNVQENVLNLINFLKTKNTKKIILSSRSYEAEKLENALGTVAYKMGGLTVPEQKQFLTEIWNNRKKGKNYASLADEIVNYHGNNEGMDLSNPLYLEMLAEYYVNAKASTVEGVSRAALYGKYLEGIVSIIQARAKLEAKSSSSTAQVVEKNIKESFMRHLITLAIRTFRPGEIDPGKVSFHNNDHLLKSIEETILSPNRNTFSHRSWAEYFVACALADPIYNDFFKNNENYLEIIKKIYFSPEGRSVISFTNEITSLLPPTEPDTLGKTELYRLIDSVPTEYYSRTAVVSESYAAIKTLLLSHSSLNPAEVKQIEEKSSNDWYNEPSYDGKQTLAQKYTLSNFNNDRKSTAAHGKKATIFDCTALEYAAQQGKWFLLNDLFLEIRGWIYVSNSGGNEKRMPRNVLISSEEEKGVIASLAKIGQEDKYIVEKHGSLLNFAINKNLNLLAIGLIVNKHFLFVENKRNERPLYTTLFRTPDYLYDSLKDQYAEEKKLNEPDSIGRTLAHYFFEKDKLKLMRGQKYWNDDYNHQREDRKKEDNRRWNINKKLRNFRFNIADKEGNYPIHLFAKHHQFAKDESGLPVFDFTGFNFADDIDVTAINLIDFKEPIDVAYDMRDRDKDSFNFLWFQKQYEANSFTVDSHADRKSSRRAVSKYNMRKIEEAFKNLKDSMKPLPLNEEKVNLDSLFLQYARLNQIRGTNNVPVLVRRYYEADITEMREIFRFLLNSGELNSNKDDEMKERPFMELLLLELIINVDVKKEEKITALNQVLHELIFDKIPTYSNDLEKTNDHSHEASFLKFIGEANELISKSTQEVSAVDKRKLYKDLARVKKKLVENAIKNKLHRSAYLIAEEESVKNLKFSLFKKIGRLLMAGVGVNEASLKCSKKRSAEPCQFFSEEDQATGSEKQNEAGIRERFIEKIISYFEDPPARNLRQLIDAASRMKSGKRKDELNKIIDGHKILNHFERLGKVSGRVMHITMAKNILADLYNQNYKGVGMNAAFIAGGQFFEKQAQILSVRGEELLSAGRTGVGKAASVSSPIVARATSAFIAYDLYNQVSAYKKGDKDAMAGMVTDSVVLSVDIAETGVEVAEVLGLIEGVSLVTAPIGAAVSALVFIGNDIYSSVKKVEHENDVIKLTTWQKFTEGTRAFVGLPPATSLFHEIEHKQKNNKMVAEGLRFLQAHDSLKFYVGPSVAVKIKTIKVWSRKGVKYGLTEPVKTYKYDIILNNNVNLNEKRNDIKWSAANPDNPSWGGGASLCFPGVTSGRNPASDEDYSIVPDGAVLLCEGAFGITDLRNKTGDDAYINLEQGSDTIIGLLDNRNIIVLQEGDKRVTGGNKDDIFIFVASGNQLIKGQLDGAGGNNLIDLRGFTPASDVSLGISIISHLGGIVYKKTGSPDFVSFTFRNVNQVIGMLARIDEISADSRVKYIDGSGGKGPNKPDTIRLLSNPTPAESYDIHLVVRPYTDILGEILHGTVAYHIQRGTGISSVNMQKFSPGSQHNIFFTYTLQNARETSLVRNGTNYNIMLSFENNATDTGNDLFNITVLSNDHLNVNYRFYDGTEIKIKGNHLSASVRSDQSIDEAVRLYAALARRLNMTQFITLANNETILVGDGKNEVMYNNPSPFRSHLIGNGGDNIFVVITGQPSIDYNHLPVPETVIYGINAENSTDTLDLRQINKQIKRDLLREIEVNVAVEHQDVLIGLGSPGLTGNLAAVRLKEAGVNKYYEHLQIISDTLLMQIDDDFVLRPLPFRSNDSASDTLGEEITPDAVAQAYLGNTTFTPEAERQSERPARRIQNPLTRSKRLINVTPELASLPAMETENQFETFRDTRQEAVTTSEKIVNSHFSHPSSGTSSGAGRLQFWPVDLVIKRVKTLISSISSLLSVSGVFGVTPDDNGSLPSRYLPEPDLPVQQQPSLEHPKAGPPILPLLKKVDTNGLLVWGILFVRKFRGGYIPTDPQVLSSDDQRKNWENGTQIIRAIRSTVIADAFMDTVLHHAETCGIGQENMGEFNKSKVRSQIVQAVSKNLAAGGSAIIPPTLFEQLIKDNTKSITSGCTIEQAQVLVDTLTCGQSDFQQRLLQQVRGADKQDAVKKANSEHYNQRAEANVLIQALSSMQPSELLHGGCPLATPTTNNLSALMNITSPQINTMDTKQGI